VTRTGRASTAIAASAAVLLLGACGGAEPTAPGATETEPAGPTAVDAAACPEASRLPVTKLCNNAAPDLFLATDPAAELIGRSCVWRTEEVRIDANQALVFRAQDCTGDGFLRNLYTYVGGYVKSRMDGTPADQASFILEIIPLAAGETPEQAAMKTLDKAPEEQRARCEIHMLPGPKLAGRPFELAPNAELKAELETLYPDEPWDACGPNGVTMDAQQFWEARASHALFHMTGQDVPPWDPASFTFYRRAADGSWAKVN
jgi:hypothetical protein